MNFLLEMMNFPLKMMSFSGATGAAAGAKMVVTSPGNWMSLAAALDEVCSQSDFFPLLVDGTGDGKSWLEMLSGGGTAVSTIGGKFVSTNPTLLINGVQLPTTCRHAFRIKPFPIECPIFCQCGLRPYDVADINTMSGFEYCCCHLTPPMTPPLLSLDGDGGIVTVPGGLKVLPPQGLLNRICDCLVCGTPLIFDFTAPHLIGSAAKRLGDLRFALEGVRRMTLAGLRSAAEGVEQQAETVREMAVRQAERGIPMIQQEADAAKDRELLALLKGELSSAEYQELRAVNASAIAAQKDRAVVMRQARVEKLAAQKAEVAAVATHASKMKAVKKEKPKKPPKGPDSSLLCVLYIKN